MTQPSHSATSGPHSGPHAPSAHLASSPATLDAVLFDLDGTLIDTLELILTSMRYATEAVLGEALPDSVLMHNVGVPLIVQMREFDEARADEILAAYRAHNEVVHDDLVKEYPGVEAALDILGSRYRLGVVTSKSRPVAERGLDAFGLRERFEVMVAYEDTEAHKPDPAPLVEAARLLGVPLARCAYVGDSPHDMAAAIAGGAISIGALWGVAGERVLEPGPDYVVDSMEALTALLVPRA
jgi:pyrophosphatase PpaX